jgi:hypothetical protein
MATTYSPIPTLYYGYFAALTSDNGMKALDVFRYTGVSKADEKIIISHLDVKNSTLQVKMQGKWVNVVKNFTLDKMLRMDAKAPFNGMAEMNFTLESRSSSHRLVILTSPSKPDLQLVTDTINITMKEGTNKCNWLQIADAFKVTNHPMIPQLPNKVKELLAKESMENVRAFRKAFGESQRRYAPKVDVDDTDTPVGRWQYAEAGKDEKVKKNQYNLRKSKNSKLTKSSKFCFIPHPRKSGLAPAKLVVGIYDSQEMS